MASIFQNLETAKLMCIGEGLIASDSFLTCADKQLTEIFIRETGIVPDKNVCLCISEQGFNMPIRRQYVMPNTNNIANMLCITLYVNHNWNPVNIYWKSKTSKNYTLHWDVDCDDIIFWFDSLDPLLYHKQLYPNEKLSFKLKNLSYELVVTRLNMNMRIEMQLKEEYMNQAETLLNDIDKIIDDYNIKSEKKDRKDGVVHNWKRKIENDKLVYDIDTGSAGSWFLKKFLMQLSKLGYFARVEVM